MRAKVRHQGPLGLLEHSPVNSPTEILMVGGEHITSLIPLLLLTENLIKINYNE